MASNTTNANRSAFYYPSLIDTTFVKIFNTEPVYGTQDLGTYCSETRHFVDYEYLKSIMGSEQLNDTITPTPECTILTGTRKDPGEQVLGKLSTLVVSIREVERGGGYTWSKRRLSNVFVVNQLPVPIHISFKALENTEEGYPRAFQEHQGTIVKDVFPSQFHSHPYWDEELRKEIVYVALGGPN